MKSISRYPSYRDSGISWIGPVPSEWEVLASARISDLTTGGCDTQDAAENGAYPFFVRSQTIERINTYSFEGEGVLTSGDGAGVGKIFHHHTGRLEFHQRVYLFYNFRQVTGRFFFYFLREHLHRVALAGNAKSTVDSLRRPMLRMFPFCLPSIEEQTQIARFLDYETAKTDALIEKQQQLIALLKEKRQAVISHAVTKGLNPDAPMRDSGVEWLGEVPAHWRTVRLKLITHSSTSGPYGSSLTKAMYSKSGVRVYGQQQVIAGNFALGDYFIPKKMFVNMRRYEVSPDDLLITVMGTIGRVAVVPEGVERGIINPRLVRYRAEARRVLPAFVRLSLLGELSQARMRLLAQGSTMEGLNMQILGNLSVPLPPLPEQSEILDEVGRATARIDELTVKVEQAVEVLQERRTALISAAVTGKIDVRDWRPPESSAEAEAS